MASQQVLLLPPPSLLSSSSLFVLRMASRFERLVHPLLPPSSLLIPPSSPLPPLYPSSLSLRPPLRSSASSGFPS
jgi:hypothetical protein